MEIKSHWESVYKAKKPTEVSWYQPHLNKSLEFILDTGVHHESEIIDVGGGASTLADDLLARSFKRITVVDISSNSLDISKARMDEQAQNIHWIEGDITSVSLPVCHYDLWHDRAVFHFLINPEDRKGYIENLKRSLKPGGHLIMATFGLKGPERCSGLEVGRYGSDMLRRELGSEFRLLQAQEEEHITPQGLKQHFLYCYFRLNKNE